MRAGAVLRAVQPRGLGHGTALVGGPAVAGLVDQQRYRILIANETRADRRQRIVADRDPDPDDIGAVLEDLGIVGLWREPLLGGSVGKVLMIQAQNDLSDEWAGFLIN